MSCLILSLSNWSSCVGSDRKQIKTQTIVSNLLSTMSPSINASILVQLSKSIIIKSDPRFGVQPSHIFSQAPRVFDEVNVICVN